MQQPTRRIGTQDVDEDVLLWAVGELAQGIQHWVVGFALAILLDTLALAGKDGFCLSQAADKGGDQGGLADACLAGNKADLALAVPDLYPQLLELGQFGRPAHKFCAW